MATIVSSKFATFVKKYNWLWWITISDSKVCWQRYSSTLATTRNKAGDSSEYTDVPEYPEIFDASRNGMIRKRFLEKQKLITDLPTVEQKLLAFMRIRHPRAVMLTPFSRSYLTTLPFYQFITKTTLIRNLPEYYQNYEVDDIYKYLEKHFINYLTMPRNSKLNAKDLIQHAAFLLMGYLGVKKRHLLSCTHHLDSRCDAFWYKGGFNPDNFYKKTDFRDSINVTFQYLDRPFLQIRTDKPLKTFVPLEHSLCNESEVPNVHINPQFCNLPYQKRRLTSTPGFWPGDPCEFPYLSMHIYNPNKMLGSLKNPEEIDDFIMSHGILSSFAWLQGIVINLGFTHFSGITYPLTTQTVVTDGQTWTFFAYQLNTISLHEYVDTNSLRNVCWTSGQMKLYESIEDGKVIGFNPEIFKTIIKYFLNVPEIREGVDLKPYLSEDKRNSEEKRKDAIRFNTFFTNRITIKEFMKEIPTWKWIYKYHPLAKPCPHFK